MLRSLMTFCLSRRPLALVGFVVSYPDPAPPIIEIIDAVSRPVS
jgi:hypothetical protein